MAVLGSDDSQEFDRAMAKRQEALTVGSSNSKIN
jgi:hypothetical protein